MWNAFISYSSEDRRVVAPLSARLYERGMTIWIDTAEISAGDALTNRIVNGLQRSTLAILVISDRYLRKWWPLFELSRIVDGFRDRTYQILVDVSPERLAELSPNLADVYSLPWTAGLAAHVDAIERLYARHRRPIAGQLDEDDCHAFLRGIVRRDNLVQQLPLDLEREAASIVGTIEGVAKVLLQSQQLLRTLGDDAVRFSVGSEDVPLGAGALHAWYVAIQVAAVRSPRTLAAILLRVRGQTDLDLPRINRVLELLHEPEKAGC